MATLTEIQKLKEKVEKLNQEIEQSKGALTEAIRRMEKEFGCRTLGEAQTLLVSLKEQTQESRQEFEAAMKEFDEKWGDELS